MLVKEAIHSVQELYSKGTASKNTRLSSRHIYSSLITARSLVLEQQINKRQKINDDCYQTLPCMELEKAPIHECSCVPNNSNLIVLRSKAELPSIISNLDGMTIQYVTSLDGSIRYDLTSFENVKYMSGNKYTGNAVRCFINNNRLYVVHSSFLKAVSVSLLAEDPIKAALFPSICGTCKECNCKDYGDFDFHTDRKTFSSIEKIAAEKLIGLFLQMKEDKFANASDDNQISGKMIHQ